MGDLPFGAVQFQIVDHGVALAVHAEKMKGPGASRPTA